MFDEMVMPGSENHVAGLEVLGEVPGACDLVLQGEDRDHVQVWRIIFQNLNAKLF